MSAETTTARPAMKRKLEDMSQEIADICLIIRNDLLKNLLEAVKQGVLSMEQVKAENGELQNTRRRLQKRLADLSDGTRLADEILAILNAFDPDPDDVLTGGADAGSTQV